MEQCLISPDLDIFTTDKKHIKIIKYIKIINDNMLFREFINNIIETNPYFFQLKNINLVLNLDNILVTLENQIVFDKKWNDNCRNFIEASKNTKYRRDISYDDLLILTLFYVLYDIDLYENIIELLEYDILYVDDTDIVSFENNNLGQIYLSFYKQLKSIYNINTPIKQIKKLLMI